MPYHSYIFFDGIPGAPKKAKEAFAKRIAKEKRVRTRAYATLGFKRGTHFMLHCNTKAPDIIQEFIRDLLHTELGKYLRISYTLLGMTRSSQYNPKKPPAQSAPEAPHRYLVVYPFTKTVEWHLLPYDERRAMMKAHVEVGRAYASSISQLLLYSFGIDDHEFIVSYQMDDLDEFQQLVMELRGTEGRRYTKNDTPIFTCTHMPVAEALEML